MELKMGIFHIKEIVWGEKTEYRNGILTINKQDALNIVLEDERVLECELHIVHPGDSVRMIPVKEIMEPRCKIGSGEVMPGYFGPLTPSGKGTTYCLKDMAVTSIGEFGSYDDGLLDMCGPGAEESWYSELIHVAMVMKTTDGREEHEEKKTIMNNESLRQATFRLGEWLTRTAVGGLEPDEWENYKFDPILKRTEEENKLPNVAFVTLLQSNGTLDYMNQTIYGWPTRRILPFTMSPTCMLDGAVTAASYHVPGMGSFSIEMINNPVIKRLFAEHGKSINFVGVIITGTNADISQKKRSIQLVKEQAELLGLDGAVVNLTGYGHTYVDFFDIITGFEEMGIKTVGLGLECSGREGTGNPYTIMNPKADKLVVCGNISQVIELPSLDKVLGDIEVIVRDPSSGSWVEDDPVYGPSLREDGSIVCEENYICGGNASLGRSCKTVIEY